MNRNRKRLAGAVVGLAAVLAGGYATTSAFGADSGPDCQQHVLRLADNLERTATLTDSTLVAWVVASQQTDQAETARLASLYGDQLADQRAAQRAYADARATCR